MEYSDLEKMKEEGTLTEEIAFDFIKNDIKTKMDKEVVRQIKGIHRQGVFGSNKPVGILNIQDKI